MAFESTAGLHVDNFLSPDLIPESLYAGCSTACAACQSTFSVAVRKEENNFLTTY